MSSPFKNSDILLQECEELNRLLTSIKTHVEESVACVTNDLNEWKQLKTNLSKTSIQGKILLDVGGREFSTTVETLTSEKDTFFTALFSHQWELEKDERGRIFIDRNGDLFADILEYMRNPSQFVISDGRMRERLLNEAKFYKLNNLITILTELEKKANEVDSQMTRFEGTTLMDIKQQLKLNEFYGTIDQTWQLIYKASQDGFDSKAFHRLCNNQGPTMTIIRSTGSYLFGGYASQSWRSAGGYTNAPNSFLFLLTNSYDDSPTKFICQNNSKAMYDDVQFGPVFGNSNDLAIFSGSNRNQDSRCKLGAAYIDALGRGANTFTGARNFQTNEIEVFKLV